MSTTPTPEGLRAALEDIAAMTFDQWTNGARAKEIAEAALSAPAEPAEPHWCISDDANKCIHKAHCMATSKEMQRLRLAAALSSSARDQEGVRDEREAFEAHFVSKFGTKPLTWREAEGGPYNVPDGMQDNYYVRSTQQSWEAWQARAGIFNSAAEIDEEAERARFHADAEPMGFDLTRHVCAAPEPWSQYKDIDTGNRWGGWLARAALAGQAKSAAPVEPPDWVGPGGILGLLEPAAIPEAQREKAHEGPLVGEMIPVEQIQQPERQSGETDPILVDTGDFGFVATPEPERWAYRRYGSEPEKGYTIVAMRAPYRDTLHGRPIAFLGDGKVAGDAAHAICEAHNAGAIPEAPAIKSADFEVVQTARRAARAVFGHYREVMGIPEAPAQTEAKMFKTTVLGVGPFCVEFPDGEIVYTRTEQRQRAIAAIATPSLAARLPGDDDTKESGRG